jgi:catechol 2,3-dioxygenase-like lactoylglutathione lyase family enzyme
MAEQTHLSLAIVYVGDLDSSVSFYSDVLGLKVTDREPTAALLAGDGRTPLILRAMGSDATRAPGSTGVQYVIWAAAGKTGLDKAERALKRHSAYVETRQGEGFTVIEGRDPDGCPVLVAYPAPDQVPLRELPARIYAW